MKHNTGSSVKEFSLKNDKVLMLMRDPFGNVVIIPKNLHNTIVGSIKSETYDSISDVITKPTIAIEEPATARLHYFRSIGWEVAILISTQKKDGQYIAYNYALNPSNAYMGELMLKGKVLE